jgi:small subunit ribosomal protein S10
MPKGRIRVRLKAYDSRVIDDCCQKILDVAVRTGARVAGPVPLPTEKEHFNVARASFIDRNSREDFMIKTHKRLIDIVEPTDKTIDQLMHLDLPAGVDVELTMGE